MEPTSSTNFDRSLYVTHAIVVHIEYEGNILGVVRGFKNRSVGTCV